MKRWLSCLALPLIASVATAAINPVGEQPHGSLSGKIIYLNAGHGYTFDDSNEWRFQRTTITWDQLEDLNNQDAMTFLVDFLWRAGATIVPMRPVGHQTLQVVLDNDDPEVTYTGAWSDGIASVFYGDAEDVPFRTTTAAATETAYARFQPDLPVAGYWPLYCWTGYGGDRVRQLYRVHHTGGATEVVVDHRMVGNGLVYLGTYYFEQGTGGWVDISNQSDDTGTVVADMIRFGNGMGDIVPPGATGPSGLLREDEAGLYWIEAHAGQGIPSSEWRASSSDLSASVSAPIQWAEQMNRETQGAMTDRAYLSYHANSSGGITRGTLGLVHLATPTPNQAAFSTLVAAEVNDDMVGLAGQFEYDWADRPGHTSANYYSEISDAHANGEFDATILERAFLDNQTDSALLSDAQVNSAVARAAYQGLVRYFSQFDGGATPVLFVPEPVTDFTAVSNGDGTVTLTWTEPATDGSAAMLRPGIESTSRSTDGNSMGARTSVAGRR